jgi:hypothetical protein
MKVCIVNDCTKIRGHFGCQMVIDTFREQLDRIDMELLGTVKNGDTRGLDFSVVLNRPEIQILKQADLVIVNSEGSVHHGTNPNLVKFAAEFPCVLMNGVWEMNPHYPELHAFKRVYMRESLSTQDVRSQGVPCETVPDIILTNKRLNEHERNQDHSGIGYTDSAGVNFKGIKPFTSPDDYLRSLDGFDAMVCGRFHAALCCMVIGIPFTAFRSNTWKNEGLMKDAGLSLLYWNLPAAASACVPTEVSPRTTKYVEQGKEKINKMFDDLWEL